MFFDISGGCLAGCVRGNILSGSVTLQECHGKQRLDTFLLLIISHLYLLNNKPSFLFVCLFFVFFTQSGLKGTITGIFAVFQS